MWHQQIKKVFRHTLEHTKMQKAVFSKMLLIHTTSRFGFEQVNTFLQMLSVTMVSMVHVEYTT